MGLIYFIRYAPNSTAGIENGTNQKKIFQCTDFRKATILEAELVKVPTVNENGTRDVGIIRFRIGIKIKLAPPPQIALIQNAKIAPTNKRKIVITITFELYDVKVSSVNKNNLTNG